MISTNSGTLISEHSVITGAGEIAGLMVAHGTLEHGNSIGILTIDGDLELKHSARAIVGIDPLSAVAPADQILVSGTLELGGHLIIELLNPGANNIGDEFQLFEAAAINGAFLRISEPDLSGFEYEGINSGITFSVAVTAVPLPASFWLLISASSLFVPMRVKR